MFWDTPETSPATGDAPPKARRASSLQQMVFASPDPPSETSVGGLVRQRIGGTWYRGRIVAHFPAASTSGGEPLWRVEFEDGDVHDMDFGECADALSAEAEKPRRAVRRRSSVALETAAEKKLRRRSSSLERRPSARRKSSSFIRRRESGAWEDDVAKKLYDDDAPRGPPRRRQSSSALPEADDGGGWMAWTPSSPVFGEPFFGSPTSGAVVASQPLLPRNLQDLLKAKDGAADALLQEDQPSGSD